MKTMKTIKTKKSIILSLLITLILTFPILSQANPLDLQYLDELIQIAEDNYIQGIPRDEHLENAIKGVFDNLDDYSKYYNQKEFEEMHKGIDGNFVGIGVYITEKEGYILITDPIKGGPAAEAGLASGDFITSISGKSTYGITSQQAVDRIKGKEGTRVLLNIKRGNRKFSVILRREKIVINPVEYEIIKNVGYIKLDQFTLDSNKYIMEALDYMDYHHIDDIILDLRNNPGGYLDQAIYIGNQFIKKGPITHVKYRDQAPISYDSHLKALKYNLVVLVNENSASASELIAAAVKDTKSGKIIGTTTFGKGTVQEIISLKNGDGIKITKAEYFSPHMKKIEGVGVVPHIEIENKQGKDSQLQKAMEIITKP